MGPEFDEVVKRLESGQPPEDIERDMPDLGAADSGGSDFGGDLEDFYLLTVTAPRAATARKMSSMISG